MLVTRASTGDTIERSVISGSGSRAEGSLNEGAEAIKEGDRTEARSNGGIETVSQLSSGPIRSRSRAPAGQQA